MVQNGSDHHGLEGGWRARPTRSELWPPGSFLRSRKLIAVGLVFVIVGMSLAVTGIALAVDDDGWLNTETGSNLGELGAHCATTPDHDDFTFSGDNIIRIEAFFNLHAWTGSQLSLFAMWDNSGDGPFNIYHDGSAMNVGARHSGGTHWSLRTVSGTADVSSWWAWEFDQVAGVIRHYDGGTDPTAPSWGAAAETDTFTAFTLDAPGASTYLAVGGGDDCDDSIAGEFSQLLIYTDFGGGSQATIVDLDFGDPVEWPDATVPRNDGAGKTWTVRNSATLTAATTTTTTTTTTIAATNVNIVGGSPTVGIEAELRDAIILACACIAFLTGFIIIAVAVKD